MIALTVPLEIKPCTKHITIKYHHFQIFFTKGDVSINNINIKEQVADIFTNPLYAKSFVTYASSLKLVPCVASMKTSSY